MAEMQSNFITAAERAGVDHIVKLSAAGADPTTSWDIARWHGTVEAGRPVEYRERSPDRARQLLREDGAPEWLAEAMVGLEVAFGKGIADLENDHVARVTGDPPRDFTTFVRDHGDAFTPD